MHPLLKRPSRLHQNAKINGLATTSATVTASDADTFDCGNVVRASTPFYLPSYFLVGTVVKNSSAADFTIFS